MPQTLFQEMDARQRRVYDVMQVVSAMRDAYNRTASLRDTITSFMDAAVNPETARMFTTVFTTAEQAAFSSVAADMNTLLAKWKTEQWALFGLSEPTPTPPTPPTPPA